MRARDVLKLLRAHESRNVTFAAPDGSWPIVWERARGVHVWDADGKKYLDLSAAFGVAAAGHANPRVVQTGQRQMAKLLHAMGDVHPHALKAQLARELSRITFERWSANQSKVQGPTSKVQQVEFKVQGSKFKVPDTKFESQIPNLKAKGIAGKTIFGNSGFEAVEAALKTALLATGKPGVIAFTGAYHGLGYGALNATHRDHFRSPFRRQLREFGHFVPFPTHAGQLPEIQETIRRVFRRHAIGAILVEPVQGRGGINLPPDGFLPLLRRLCDELEALLIADEVFTGFGRTGKWFACEHTHAVPDLICLGKALTGGFPLSACVGRAGLMDAAWPEATGEAIHTSTYLGHPVGCAMALAQIGEIRRQQLVKRSFRLGEILLRELATLAPQPSTLNLSSRGLGLMAGLELRTRHGSPATQPALRLIQAMLRRGYILLPEGEHGNVISFTPPLTITESQLRGAVRALAGCLPAL